MKADTEVERNECEDTACDTAAATAPEALGDRAKLEMIDIDQLDAHPQNPRIGGLREDVVSAIEASVRADGFKPYFAGIGRTKSDGRTEILKGHHQTEGARRAGLKAIPMWIVNDMTDEEALRVLAFSNAQGELTPLEIGLASFAVVPAKGRKGLGLADFASRMGIKAPNLSRYRRGVDVYRALVEGGASDDVIRGCRDRAEHLALIKGADPGRWRTLVEECVQAHWSIEQTKLQVAKLLTGDGHDEERDQQSEAAEHDAENRSEDEGDSEDEGEREQKSHTDNSGEEDGDGGEESDDHHEDDDEDADDDEEEDADGEEEDGDDQDDEEDESTEVPGKVSPEVLTALGATDEAEALTRITELRQHGRAAQAEAERLRKTVAKLEKERDMILDGAPIGAVLRELSVNNIKQALAAIKELKSNAAA